MYPSAVDKNVERAMSALVEDALREAVYRVIKQNNAGKPAADIVHEVVRANRVNPDLVRKILRMLLERGDLTVGPTLNLIVKSSQHRAHSG
jgi:Fe2+ or Zn2+ uptake regulation protein